MTKKSRRPLKNGRDQVGCIFSFIRVFDFRIGWSTRKLIAEQKHAGRQPDEIQTDKVSVKDIVQKDMCFEEEEGKGKGNSSDLGGSVKEFVNKPQKSSSKKEPISKILNDFSFEVQSLSDVNMNTRKNRNLFLRKHKPQMDNSDRIVILKPGTSRKLSSGLSSSDDPEKKCYKTERFSSQFSFTEIKKKLKHAITKERNRIPYQRLVENTEKNSVKGNLGWNSPTRDHFFHERFVMPAFGSKKEQDKAKAGKLQDRDTKVSIEGKKRLSEIILTSGDDEIAKLSSQEVPKTLENLGSSENTMFDCQSLPRLKIAISLDLFDGRECQTSDISETEHRNGDVDSRNDHQERDLFQEDESSPTIHRSISKTVEALETSSMRPERLSPISVLDPITAEDDSVSPPTTKSSKRPVEPRRISFEEPVVCLSTHLADEESAFEYVEAVLLASDLNWDEFLLRWISSDPVLDSALFHEVELFSSRSLHEQKLLFDCTNEILEDFCEQYFCRYSNMLIMRPTSEDVIREVWEGVDCNLSWPTPYTTLEDTVKRDMERNRKWMSLRSDVEKIGIEIEEIILEQLVEDTIMCIPNEVVTEMK